MNRIVQIDFFRGLFLLLITTNHFFIWQNIIRHFTDEFIGWVTAAEGFVFLSGLTAGIVYSRKLVEKGEDFVTRSVKKRALTIYKYHLFIFLLVAILLCLPMIHDYWFTNHLDFRLLTEKPLSSILLSILLLYQPVNLDILPMYALFILVTPITLTYFQKKKHLNILAISFIAYLVGVFVIGTFKLVPLSINQFEFMEQVHIGFFNLLCWQLLFIGGLYFGYLTYQNQMTVILQNKKLLYSAIGISLLLLFFKKAPNLLELHGVEVNYWTDKGMLGPLRLLNFSALLVVVSYLASRYKKWFSFKPLCYLGKHSLEVFSMHILLVFAFKPLQEALATYSLIKVTSKLNVYPWGTMMLIFILIPCLFLSPKIKKRFDYYRFNSKLFKQSSNLNG